MLGFSPGLNSFNPLQGFGNFPGLGGINPTGFNTGFTNGFNSGFGGQLAAGWAEIARRQQAVPRQPDPREPYSLFNFNATLRDTSQFYLWGAPNEMQALIALQNPDWYWSLYDQPPNPAYYTQPPSWITSMGNQVPGLGGAGAALGSRLNQVV